MRRTTIFLPDVELRRTQRLARQRGMSFAELVRRALSRYLEMEEEAGNNPLPSIAGRFQSGTADTSERADELLWSEPHG